MPKNGNGDIECINKNIIIDGKSHHEMATFPGFGVLPKERTIPGRNPEIDDKNGVGIKIYVCTNCKYTELYMKDDEIKN